MASSFRPLGRFIAVLAFSGYQVGAAEAADICVSNVQQLRQAFSHAGGNGQHDLIILGPGRYALEGSRLQLPLLDGMDLVIRSAMPGDDCFPSVQRFDPSRTIIDANYQSAVIDLWTNQGSNVTIAGITFARGRNDGWVPPVRIVGGCISYQCWSGSLRIENSHFFGHVSSEQSHPSHGAVMLGAFSTAISNHGRVVVRNSTFSLNITHDCAPAIQIGLRNWNNSPAYIRNNTVISNGCLNYGQALALSGHGYADFDNNLFYENFGLDVYFGAGQVTPRNNRWRQGNTFGGGWTGSGNIHVEPQIRWSTLDPSGVLYLPKLANGSPMINAGRTPTAQEGGHGGWDGYGGARVVGAGIDIGAHEWDDRIHRDGFQ